jgi:hypothetical protein
VSSGTGGDTGAGGAPASGGATGTGGNAGSTGITGTGGGKGGSTGSGGTAGSSGSKGGNIGSGGAVATGGTPGAGGKGGTTGTGGSGTGGSNGSGGSGGSSSGGSTGSGGSNVMQPPPITNGMSGWASRYWDCCKPACGWTGNVTRGNPMTSCDISDNSLGGNYTAANACGGGSAFMCWSGVPWSVSDTLSYGYAAASGNNYTCGRCYQIQFTGTNNTNGDKMGTPVLNGKTMIVQVINNGGVAATQFDLLIPGGGVGALNACSTQWGSSVDLGTQYGGWLSECNGSASCVQQKCQAAFSNKTDLMNGCNWFLNWFGASNNPDFTYQQIACPAALTQASGLSDPG